MSKKDFKWLDMHYHYDVSKRSEGYTFSNEFLEEFDRQMKPQFETYFQRPMNWGRLWFFVAPMADEYILKNVTTDSGIKRTYLLQAEISSGKMYIPCKIYWESLGENKFIHPREKVKKGEIKIVLEHVEDSPYKERFPGLNDKTPRRTWTLNTYFPIWIEGPYLSHENYYALHVPHIDLKTKIDESFSKSFQIWNDPEEVLAEVSEERGILHHISHDSTTENILKYYLDGGSASYLVHQYFIEQLSKEVEGIEKLIIYPVGS